MSNFNKNPLSFTEQIELLKSRGLIIDNNDEAERYLKNISYYKLSGYWHTFLKPPHELHQFKSNTKFSQIIKTFIFDRKLRLLIFDQLERIENSFKTQLIYNYSIEFGSHWYLNETLYKNINYKNRFIEILYDTTKSSKEIFINHYKTKYTEPELPPSWMSLEIISLGQVSLLYKNLKISKAKKEIAHYFGVDAIVLESWFESLSFVRNICAHHSRLWNRQLPIKPMIPRNPYNEWLTNIPDRADRIYIILTIIFYLSKIINPNTTFNEKLTNLLIEYPEIPLHYMGFPMDWKKDKFWNFY
ncbi:MAG: Abi family protein [Bacteroidetes bacterium]|nr:MAG: Abi family protein [Bacteroidota bacterium]